VREYSRPPCLLPYLAVTVRDGRAVRRSNPCPAERRDYARAALREYTTKRADARGAVPTEARGSGDGRTAGSASNQPEREARAGNIVRPRDGLSWQWVELGSESRTSTWADRVLTEPLRPVYPRRVYCPPGGIVTIYAKFTTVSAGGFSAYIDLLAYEPTDWGR